MDKLNIAIADDNAKVLQLLDKIVSSDEELNVVGKAGNGEDLYDIIKKQEPDVVLLDLVMPKVDGLTVMERVNKDPGNPQTSGIHRHYSRRPGEDHGRCI